MKIALIYPPFSDRGRFPTLPQNRQFVYTASKQVRIFPVVLATAATWLKNLGHQVLWLDGVSRRLSKTDFDQQLLRFSPEVIVLETKAPIMEKVWEYVKEIKQKSPSIKVVLIGDHTTYYPEESFTNCPVDYILTGGDYDFLLVSLVNHLDKGKKLAGGIWLRKKTKNGQLKIMTSGKNNFDENLDKIPVIDRELTRWKDYGEAYLIRPVAYMMFGRGCGIGPGKAGVCNFCIWQYSLWGCRARLRPVNSVVDEIEGLINLGVREIFDDTESGAVWNVSWLKSFYLELKKRGLLGKVILSSNARADQLTPETCRLLKTLNYRLLKVGMESGSNKTLSLINKKETIEQITEGVRNAKDAGLRVMLTIMVGYPWETEKEVEQTYVIAKDLMGYKTRAGDCLQASVITPYPGTPLWQMAIREKWLKIKTLDYEKYDMSQPILKSCYNAPYWCNRIWTIQKEPMFILKSGLSIRRMEELLMLIRGGISLLGHTKDYEKSD